MCLRFRENPAWMFNQISTYSSKWKHTSKQVTAKILDVAMFNIHMLARK